MSNSRSKLVLPTGEYPMALIPTHVFYVRREGKPLEAIHGFIDDKNGFIPVRASSFGPAGTELNFQTVVASLSGADFSIHKIRASQLAPYVFESLLNAVSVGGPGEVDGPDRPGQFSRSEHRPPMSLIAFMGELEAAAPEYLVYVQGKNDAFTVTGPGEVDFVASVHMVRSLFGAPARFVRRDGNVLVLKVIGQERELRFGPDTAESKVYAFAELNPEQRLLWSLNMLEYLLKFANNIRALFPRAETFAPTHLLMLDGKEEGANIEFVEGENATIQTLDGRKLVVRTDTLREIAPNDRIQWSMGAVLHLLRMHGRMVAGTPPTESAMKFAKEQNNEFDKVMKYIGYTPVEK